MMTSTGKGLLLALLHVVLMLGIGGKLLYDRHTRPRMWVRAYPYDPSLPIRGRYVRLRLEGAGVSSGEPVAFFIPEAAADPSILHAGEELWAEVTLPKKGPVRPIQLAVKSRGMWKSLGK
jgi:hypothetical protein